MGYSTFQQEKNKTYNGSANLNYRKGKFNFLPIRDIVTAPIKDGLCKTIYIQTLLNR